MKVFLFTVFSLTVLIYGFNVHIDEAGQQSAAQVFELARTQNKDQILIWDRLFDQRIWLKARLEMASSTGCPDMLIFSSSTLGRIDAASFPDQQLINGWMSAPTIEDLEALIEIIDRGNCHHMEMWLGMDPWFFNTNAKSDRWSSIFGDFAAYQRKHGTALRIAKGYLTFWTRFKDRLSFVTTRESLYYFINHRHDKENLVQPRLVQGGGALDEFCANASTDLYVRFYDGHFQGCPRFALSQKEVSSLATTYLQRNTHSMQQWSQVDPDTVGRLKAAVELLSAMGLNITLIAPPYHPAAYASLYANHHVRDLLDQVDILLADVARANGGQFVNLRNPAIAGCPDSEFEDSHHASSDCLRKVVRIVATQNASTGR